MDSPEYYLLATDIAEELLTYLAKRPYIEVVSLIKALEKMPPVASVIQEKATGPAPLPAEASAQD
jgi:hypothetical protein